MDPNIFISPEDLQSKLSEVFSGSESFSFIFGAGASKGYTKNRAMILPPTVIELFDSTNAAVAQTIRRHPKIFNQQSRFQSKIKINPDLEKYLSTLYERQELDLFADLLNYLQDLYYLSSENIDTDHETNNYMKLIYVITELRKSNDPWTCISFNYDTIFEKSFNATNWFNSIRSFTQSQDYQKHTNPKLLKVHGGINFRFTYKEVGNHLIKKSPREIFNFMMKSRGMPGTRHEFINLHDKLPQFYDDSQYEWNQSMHRNEKIHQYNLPLMMIPIHETRPPQDPMFEQMLNDAIEELKISSLVISIGYNFGDYIFRDKIKEIDTTKKDLILVGLEDLLNEGENHISYKQISETWGGSIKILNDARGFSGFVDSLPLS